MAKSKPRGLYYADQETRNRVAKLGGQARAEKYAAAHPKINIVVTPEPVGMGSKSEI